MKHYRVFCGEKELPVYPVTVSAMPFNRVWAGQQRSKTQTEPAFFVTVDTDTAVELTITVEEGFES